MRKFILSRYILREHIGPFCFSFSAITLIFLLDLLFRQFSRMLSKGLPLRVVVEFFALNMAWIVATALPMAVLTATVMAFGRLAADHEVTAMQAGGVSLLRQVTPVFVIATLLAAGLIWFNDHVLPDCNHRARVLAMDIARKKPAVKIEPGVWCNDIPNYGLLVQALEDSAYMDSTRTSRARKIRTGATKAYQLLIDDNSKPQVRRTISAHSGLIQLNPADGTLLLTLYDGEIQEINLEKPEDFQRLKFSKHLLSIAAEDMFLRRSEPVNGLAAPEFRNDREKSTQQMWQEVKASETERALLEQQLNFLVGADLHRLFGASFGLVPDSLVERNDLNTIAAAESNHRQPGRISGRTATETTGPRGHHIMTADKRRESKSRLLSQHRFLLRDIEEKLADIRLVERIAQSLLVEIHKKYAIAGACIVFVLIGAPLGALARRSGLATGVGLSLGFFLLYWAFFIGGEDLADRQIVSPFLAMWTANFITSVFGVCIFRFVAAGKLATASLKIAGWLDRLFSRDLFLRKRREIQREPDEHSYEPQPVEPETKGEEPEWPGDELVLEPPPAPFVPAPAAPKHTPSSFDLTSVLKILQDFVDRAHADLALLSDRNGMALAHYSSPWPQLPPISDVDKIAGLAAGQIAAAREIASGIGENGYLHSVFQEGERRNTFIYQIGNDFVLIALVEKSQRTGIGLVRIHANQMAASLQEVLYDELKSSPSTGTNSPPPKEKKDKTVKKAKK